MTDVKQYPTTRQGVRDLDRPAYSTSASSLVNVGLNERAASSLGGAILAGLGLGRGGLGGLALAALGGALIYRGATGHCSAYQAVGINTAN
jgi:uncharacterized membrane protein